MGIIILLFSLGKVSTGEISKKNTESFHVLFTQIQQLLTFFHICFIILFVPFFLYHLRAGDICMLLNPLMFQYVYPKNKDIFLCDYNTVIKFMKFNIDAILLFGQ